jgi:glycosyltransferase involved in cell wall biosynthesis
MTVLEAMACGCPVIGYPGGAVAEVTGGAAGLVDDGDLDALTDEARKLALDVGYRRARADAGRTRALQFDVRRSVQTLAGEYASVISRV